MSRPGQRTDIRDISPRKGKSYQEAALDTGVCQQTFVRAAATSARFVLVLSLIFTIHFACLGGKNAAPVGVTIFDTLFIAANGSFTVKGDLYLKETHVLGKGALRLHGDSPQQIVSLNSQVTNLDLTNPGLVTLHGELCINQSLSIDKGTLDAFQSNLYLSGGIKIKLLGGAKLLARPELLASIRLPGAMLSRPVFTPDAILPPVIGLRPLKYRRGLVGYKRLVQHRTPVNLGTALLPPESMRVC